MVVTREHPEVAAPLREGEGRLFVDRRGPVDDLGRTGGLVQPGDDARADAEREELLVLAGELGSSVGERALEAQLERLRVEGREAGARDEEGLAVRRVTVEQD